MNDERTEVHDFFFATGFFFAVIRAAAFRFANFIDAGRCFEAMASA